MLISLFIDFRIKDLALVQVFLNTGDLTEESGREMKR